MEWVGKMEEARLFHKSERGLLAFEATELTNNVTAVMELYLTHKKDLQGESILTNEDN